MVFPTLFKMYMATDEKDVVYMTCLHVYLYVEEQVGKIEVENQFEKDKIFM